MPAFVSRRPSRRRCSSGVPMISSSRRICWLRVGWAMNIRSAAWVKLPSSARATKYRKCLSSRPCGAPVSAWDASSGTASACFMSVTYARRSTRSPYLHSAGRGTAIESLKSLVFPGDRGPGRGPQHRRAEPAAGLQREFHVVLVLAHWPAEAFLGLADPVLDGVLVQHQPFGGRLVAAPGVQEDQQGVAQPGVVLIISGQARQRG